MIADRNIDPVKFKAFIDNGAFFFEPQLLQQEISLDEYSTKLISKGTISYVEEEIGIVGAVIGYTNDLPDSSSYITQVFILPEYRGKGYSTILLSEYIMFCRKKGLQKVWLTTKKDNIQAQKVYEKAGFIKDNNYMSERLVRYDFILTDN